ncbi:uncharacterized protein GGS25DRAFT_477260 [Hypoxylon fragiforme]|uniref:uncharacterized protein n=1 Tax=Hypoxylon fragiforme TaxID=63214 RepID=UPI0020C5E72B|nr:uncharacterized protein GGS25DRAFT_477260 [Hypoxylon fragiforme]KAI2612823.1 hypothetical protein GGS25DRAFT_477260 [Hypoxylon fragiforme]
MTATILSSIPNVDPHSIKSRPGNCGVTVEIYPPPTPDRLSSQMIPNQNSSNLHPIKAAKSVEDLPAIGALPFGSLRVNRPTDTEDPPIENPTKDPAKHPTNIAMELSPAATESGGYASPTGGDVLILDDLPANFTVGCDTMSFSTKTPFPGFRDIPPGTHLVWVAPSELTSTRSAYWIITPRRAEKERAEVYVKQWDKFNEVLSDPASQAEERFQRERLEQIYSNLSPYKLQAATSGALLPPPNQEADNLPSFLSNDTIWSQLTSTIDADLLNRITGKVQRSWPVTTLDRIAGETTMAEEARLYASDKSELRFMFPMNKPLISPTAEGRERTRQALDPTQFVLDTLENTNNDSENSSIDNRRPSDLVGELSFAFLTGMHLGNFSCLEQWWFYATKLVFRTFDLATSRPQLALHLIQTFHAQLVYNDRHLEGDILEMMPSNAKALQKALVTYKARLNESLLALGDRIAPDQQAVGAAFASLESWLWRLGWDLRGQYLRSGTLMLEDGEVVEAELSDFEDEDERGDFAPVVVELDPGGREAGLVSWDG